MSFPYVSMNSRHPSESSQFFNRVSRLRRVPVKVSGALGVFWAMNVECINPEGIRPGKAESNTNLTEPLPPQSVSHPYGSTDDRSVFSITGADQTRHVLS